MRRYFLTGLAILLPTALTIFVVAFAVNLLTKPFLEFVESSLSYYDIFNKPFLLFSAEQVLLISSKLFILAALISIALLLGLLARTLLTKSLINLGEYVIQRIPIVNTIYKTSKEVVKSFLSSKGSAFSQVAIVPFPHQGVYSIALISGDHKIQDNDDSVPVFIPTTPNPTIGYMLTIKKTQLIFIDMKVEDAIKCIVSCGIMFPALQLSSSEENPQDIAAK